MEPIKQFDRLSLSLDNVIIPVDRLLNTPSQKDGMSHELEVDLRITGCEYIQSAGLLLKLPQVAMATAQILFHRFYYAKSFVKFNCYYSVMACMFLAAKIEESSRRLRDVINVFHHLRQKRKNSHHKEWLRGSALSLTLTDPTVFWRQVVFVTTPLSLSSDGTEECLVTPVPMDYVGEEYFHMRNYISKYERYILKELGFLVHIQHPHKLIIACLQILELEKNNQLAQRAWNFMNDGLRTNIFVRYTVQAIACSCIFLAARQLQINLPTSPPWWELFDIQYRDMKAICFELIALYKRPRKQLHELEKQVERVKQLLLSKGDKVDATPPTSQIGSPSLSSVETNAASQTHSPQRGISPLVQIFNSKDQHVTAPEEETRNSPVNGHKRPCSRTPPSVDKRCKITTSDPLTENSTACKPIISPIKLTSGSEDDEENGLPLRYRLSPRRSNETRHNRHKVHKHKSDKRHQRSLSRERSTSRERRRIHSKHSHHSRDKNREHDYSRYHYR